jgi:hypothetical protein
LKIARVQNFGDVAAQKALCVLVEKEGIVTGEDGRHWLSQVRDRMQCDIEIVVSGNVKIWILVILWIFWRFFWNLRNLGNFENFERKFGKFGFFLKKLYGSWRKLIIGSDDYEHLCDCWLQMNVNLKTCIFEPNLTDIALLLEKLGFESRMQILKFENILRTLEILRKNE